MITQEKSRRTVEYAFGFAYLNNRRKVTAIHKANIMKLSDGLFLKARTPQNDRHCVRGPKESARSILLSWSACCDAGHASSASH